MTNFSTLVGGNILICIVLCSQKKISNVTILQYQNDIIVRHLAGADSIIHICLPSSILLPGPRLLPKEEGAINSLFHPIAVSHNCGYQGTTTVL